MSEYGWNVVASPAILVFGWLAAKLITRVVRGVMDRADTEATLTRFLANLTYPALMTLIVIVAIRKLGVPPTSFIAVIGAVGPANGLALQGSPANFAAGVRIIAFRPFRTAHDSVRVRELARDRLRP